MALVLLHFVPLASAQATRGAEREAPAAAQRGGTGSERAPGQEDALLPDANEAKSMVKVLEEGLANGVTQDERIRRTRLWITRRVFESRAALERARLSFPCEGTEEFWKKATLEDWRVPVSREELRRLEGDAALAKCEDPLVLYLWLRHIERPVPSSEFAKGARRLHTFLGTPDASHVHPVIRLKMASLLSYLVVWGREEAREKSIAAIASTALVETFALCGSRADGDRTPGSDAWWQRELVILDAVDAMRLIEWGGGVEMRDKAVERACAVKGLDPWLKHALLAEHHVELAWEARGGAYADETPVERFQAADEEVPSVVKHAEVAFKEDPTHCQPAICVIRVLRLAPELKGGFEWVLRGLRAAPDDKALWDAMEQSIRPRWVPKEHKGLLVTLALAALTQDPGRSDIPSKAHECLRILQADGYRLDKLINIVGREKLVGALTTTLKRATDRGSPKSMRALRASLVGLAFATRDWDLFAEHMESPEGFDAFALRDHALSPRRVERMRALLTDAGAAGDVARKAIEAELDQRWGQAAALWTDVVATLAPNAPMGTRAMFTDHQALAGAMVEFSQGVPLKLTARTASALFWAQNCQMGAGGEGLYVAYSSTDELRAPYCLGFSTAEFGPNIEVSGTFIFRPQDSKQELQCGILVHVGASYPQGFAAFIWNPSDGEGRIGHADALSKGVNRFKTPPLPASKRMPFRVVVRGSSGEVFLDGQSVWKGRWPDGDQFRRRGQGIGVIARGGLGSTLSWKDLTVTTLPPN